MAGDLVFDGMSDSPRRRSHARREAERLVSPRREPGEDEADRDAWIQEVCNGFVSRGTTNKAYYKVVLETLWPRGHGIPGPHVSEDEIREAINRFRRENRVGRDPDRRYLDVFRRVRELQGEEGVVGIIKQGKTYQLVDLELVEKRVPRTGLSDSDWALVLARYEGKCPSCSRQPPEVELEQDHKIPRVRGGGDELANWQPLCTECNNHKSIRCRGCQLNCNECPWAFPELYASLRVSRENVEAVRKRARELDVDPHLLANRIIEEHIREYE